MTFHSVGNEKSSQLTLTSSFFRGVGISPTSIYIYAYIYIYTIDLRNVSARVYVNLPEGNIF